METSRVVKTFLEYVQISSESRWEAAFSQRLAEDLQQIGLTVETDDSADKVKANTGNLYAFLPGEADLEPILLCAHMDTVPPGQGIHPVIEDGIIRSASDTILGSDDKSGAAAIVEALREIVQQKLPHRPVEVVFTICEEVGLLGAKYLDYSRLRAKKAVVFDNEGDVGTIVNQAPGHVEISATITGRAAHAGVAPEEGISAIQVAAEAVSQMQLLRIDAETTANIGTFFAAGPNNIVPETVRLAAEVRSLDPSDFADCYTHQWSNALCERRRQLDMLAAAAFDGDRMIGMAGCSADCETMWQIGIDVLPGYRNRGVASALTSRLAAEIMQRGKIPFYCAAWSNIPSARNAIRSGFRPAWVELTAVDGEKAAGFQ